MATRATINDDGTDENKIDQPRKTERLPEERPAQEKRPILTPEQNQRRVFGGFNKGAAFFGWLVATGVGVLLTALLSAAGSAVAVTQSTSSLTQNASTVGVTSGILLLIDLAISYYVGGYVAGRMSRFDGGRQGFGVWAWGIVVTILLALAGAGLGAKYNLLQQINLPHIPVNEGSLTQGGIITLVLILVVTVLAAIAGGKVGERYHRKVDRAAVPLREAEDSRNQ